MDTDKELLFLTSHELLSGSAVAVLAESHVFGLQLTDALLIRVHALVVLVVLRLQEAQTFLLLNLLLLCLFTGATDGVVVLGTFHAVLRVETLRLGLDPILAWLGRRGVK